MSLFNIPSPLEYERAFRALESKMTKTRRALLSAHYHFRHHEATMTQIAEAMGWKYHTGNAQYGKLANLVAMETGFRQPGCHLRTLCLLAEPQAPGDHWRITMRPEVASALHSLGWV